MRMKGIKIKENEKVNNIEFNVYNMVRITLLIIKLNTNT